MSTPNLLTVSQFANKHPALTPSGLRSLIFHANSNGLTRAGAIVRIGRKVTIDETKFFAWVNAQNHTQSGGV